MKEDAMSSSDSAIAVSTTRLVADRSSAPAQRWIIGLCAMAAVVLGAGRASAATPSAHTGAARTGGDHALIAAPVIPADPPPPPTVPAIGRVRPDAVTGGPLTETVLIAGDIATCGGSRDTATARIVEAQPGLVITAGDNAYPSGSLAQFRACYDPTWGRFLTRTRSTLGNHDVATPGAAGYFAYFGRRAGPPGRGYQAFDVGSWRVYALDSTVCYRAPRGVSGCRPGTPMQRWLRADLVKRPRQCVLAVWHHPRFSSGPHGNSSRVQPLLRTLHRAGAEIVVNGHDHLYERFLPARPDGTPDPATGIRQFIAGTGGGGLYPPSGTPARNSVVRSATYGVLRLRLRDDGYGWRFLPIRGSSFTDAGSAACHGPPAAA
jgi:hypothetical protein